MDYQSKVKFLEYVSEYLRLVISDPDLRHFIACQFALESDFGTSNLATKQNNICGMRPAKVRITTRIPFFKGDFAYYDDWEDCILDYLLWLAYKGIGQKNLILYFYKSWLSTSGYCPDKDYVERIEYLYNCYY